MALPNDGIAPAPFELRLRFVVGALLGALVAAFSYEPTHLLGFIALVALVGLMVGLLARHFGDRFWYSVRPWLWFG